MDSSVTNTLSMTKFVAQLDPGKVVIGLGLSRENIRRMQAEEDPIVTSGDAMGLKGVEILIFAYEDDHTVAATLSKLGFEFPTDPAKIHIDPKLGG